jgi:predicted CoA-binding protein
MPTRELIDRFLAGQHFALVGASRNPKQFANVVLRQLRADGRTVYPVNEHTDLATVEGETCYHSLADVPDPVDGVIVMVAADKAARVVAEAADRGITKVWLHRGAGPNSVSTEAVELCRERGIEVVDGACPLMFEPHTGWIHRVHARFSARRIAA